MDGWMELEHNSEETTVLMEHGFLFKDKKWERRRAPTATNMDPLVGLSPDSYSNNHL